jgi:hypothetical protein
MEEQATAGVQARVRSSFDLEAVGAVLRSGRTER